MPHTRSNYCPVTVQSVLWSLKILNRKKKNSPVPTEVLAGGEEIALKGEEKS